MIEKLKALPKPVKIIGGFLLVAIILGALSACTQPPMAFDLLPRHSG
jgi:hypothetical protein